jgi:pterin-4a-carbinolamine dehydratase
MSKDKNRIKSTGEVFTPTPLVNEILDKLPPELFSDPTKTYIDPACGNGQFLAQVFIRKQNHHSTIQQALSTIYGVDLMVDNVCNTIARLYILATYNQDVFDHNDVTSHVEELGHEPDAHPDYYWLKEQTYFIRTYVYNDELIYITCSKKKTSAQGIFMECNGKLWPTIVCANSLEFLKEDNDFKPAQPSVFNWVKLKWINPSYYIKEPVKDTTVVVKDKPLIKEDKKQIYVCDGATVKTALAQYKDAIKIFKDKYQINFIDNGIEFMYKDSLFRVIDDGDDYVMIDSKGVFNKDIVIVQKGAMYLVLQKM